MSSEAQPATSANWAQRLGGSSRQYQTIQAAALNAAEALLSQHSGGHDYNGVIGECSDEQRKQITYSLSWLAALVTLSSLGTDSYDVIHSETGPLANLKKLIASNKTSYDPCIHATLAALPGQMEAAIAPLVQQRGGIE